MSDNNRNLRFGVFAEGSLSGHITKDKALELTSTAVSLLQIALAPGSPVETTINADGGPQSAEYLALSSFGAFVESELHLYVFAGMLTDDLIVGNDREITPVNYVVLDDKVLEYTNGKLTKVTSESGGEVILGYDGDGNLTEVSNMKTGITKTLAYNAGNLTKVTSKKNA